MSTTGMNLASLGLGSSTSSSSSGIDVTAVVDQILYADRAPERLWQAQQSSLTSQAGVLSSINTNLADLSTKLNALKDSFGVVSTKSVTSSQSGFVTGTAQSTALSGNHTIVVSKLASTSAYYSDGVDSSATFASGTLSLQVGSGTTLPINIDSTNNTVSSLAAYINGLDAGVNASVINDSTGSRLVLASTTTGSAGDLTLSGQLSLASDGSSVKFGKITGQDASLTIDGVPVSSSSNTVVDVLPGVTLNLINASPDSPVQLSIAPDTASITSAVNQFVTSYNTIIQAINAQFTVSGDGSSAPPLEANTSLRILQSDLLSNMTYSMTGNNGITSLASIGITMNNDGTLSLDSTELANVLQNHFADFQNFFQSVDTSNQGFGYHFGIDLLNLTDPTQGVLNVELTQNAATQKMLTDQINDFEDQLAITQQLLIAQYSKVDAALRQYSTILSQVTSELGTLPSMNK